MRNRFAVAMVAFAVLGVLAATTLTDQKVRGVTLAILAMFAVRTWVQHRRQEHDAAQHATEEKFEPM